MAIWWKKTMYSRTLKAISVIGILFASSILFVSFLSRAFATSDSDYAYSWQFRNEFISKAGYLRDWIVRYDESTIFSEVTREDIEDYRKNDGRTLTDEEAIAGIMADRKSYYSKIQNELITTNKNFDFLAIHMKSNRVITNMQDVSIDEAITELMSRSNHLLGNGYYVLNYKYSLNGDSYEDSNYMSHERYYVGNKFEAQDDYRIYAALKEELVPGDAFYTRYTQYEKSQRNREALFTLSFVALGVAVILLVYWMSVIGRTEKRGPIQLMGIDYMPFEIQCLLAIGVIVLFIESVSWVNQFWNINELVSFTEQGMQVNGMALWIISGIVAIVGAALLRLLASLIKHIKNKSVSEYIWCLKMVKGFWNSRGNKGKLLVGVIIIIGINLMVDLLIFLTSDFYFSNFYVLIRPILWNGFLGIILLKLGLDYMKVLQGAKDIAEGHLERKIELSGTMPMIKELGATINSIGAGLEKAVGESIKSERLKTELITNVSHDLKTPLTSIISYVDLLKGEQIENETAREYIGILDERSHRLKQLVEDLVEASKAVTGNVKAELMVLRLDELVGQAIGEYADRIEERGLLLVSDQMKEVGILADGRHMWRVIENLLSNVCKYAMPHTRVYIEVYEEGKYGYCTIKNISKDPLNIDPNELTERFVRGDDSRTTEGSGLGLAIAQSLVSLQGGHLGIHIDGDLFKITVSMPLAERVAIHLDKDEV